MRTEVGAVWLVVCAGLGCLGKQSQPALPDGAAVQPLTQAVQVQAAYNETTFFLNLRWVSPSIAPDMNVALSGRTPTTEVRDFAVAGCFLGCHDRSDEMPNWLPADGHRTMYLLPSFGGPADLWMWRALPGNPAGEVSDGLLGINGLGPDPDGGAGTLSASGSFVDQVWDVVYLRPLVTSGVGDVPLAVGATYDVGISFHPDGTSGRHHYVSLPTSIGLGGPGADLNAVALAGATTPDFSDTASFPALSVTLFLPGVTSFEFLVGAVVDRNGQLRNNDYRHGGANAVSTGQHACADCHRVVSDSVMPALQNAGALERLVLRRGGVFGPPQVEVTP